MSKAPGTRRPGKGMEASSPESRKRAGVVLEVLAGSMSPAEAARALGISPPKYYMVEARALEGLVSGCEPRKKGPGVSAEKEFAGLQKEKARLERQVARLQALVRAQQRASGVVVPKAEKDSGKKRKRRPSARALKYVRALRAPEAPNKSEPRAESVGSPG